MLIELDGVRFLTDPLLRARVAHLRRAVPLAGSLPTADVVLISHGHHDHLDLPSLRLLGSAPRVFVPGGLVGRIPGPNVVAVDEGDERSVGAVTVRVTPAEHDGGRPPFGGGSALGYALLGTKRVFFAGDTDLFDGMSDLAPGLDVALLPIAGWGARLPPGHLDPRTAAEALRLLRPRVVVPIHWGTYKQLGLRRGDEILRAPAEAFAQHAAELAPDVDVRLLPVGGTLELETPIAAVAQP